MNFRRWFGEFMGSGSDAPQFADGFPGSLPEYHTEAELRASPQLCLEAMLALNAVAETLEPPYGDEGLQRNPVLPSRRLSFKDQEYHRLIMGISAERFDLYAKPKSKGHTSSRYSRYVIEDSAMGRFSSN